MKNILKIVVLGSLWLALSAHDGRCSSPPPLPIIDSVTVVSSSDGDSIAETSDTWIEIKIKGRNLGSLSYLSVCNSSSCLSATKTSPYAYTYRISGWSIGGTYKVRMTNEPEDIDSDYSSKRSNTCYVQIY